ncbi:MAG: twin-arginine translocase TatA/TatE family subunit [Azospirillum sp.]|nr:twin-arginine translocase TatA/TatE family subunit [Azospirillum sp.]MCZ8124061.1 twin-arginine translocase TatA/TatE family subunit [Magnetospirillum sp.]
MGMTSIWHWLILLVVVLLLFGAGKIPKLMGDMASGIKAFKKGMKEDEAEGQTTAPSQPAQVTGQPAAAPSQAADKPKV